MKSILSVPVKELRLTFLKSINLQHLQKGKNKTIAGILALTFGAFGIHRHYLNQTGLGYLYLFLFIITLGLFSIINIVDGFRILLMDDDEFDLKYNPGKIEQRTQEIISEKRDRKANKKETTNHRHAYEPDPASIKRNFKKIKKDNKYKLSGIQKFRNYEIKEAKKDFFKALEVDNQDIAVHFNIACCYSVEENIEECLVYLSKAVELGFKDFDKIKSHDALAYLRAHDEYDDFVKNKYIWESKKDKEEKAKVIEPIKNEPKEEEVSFDLLDQLSNQKEKEAIILAPNQHEKEINSTKKVPSSNEIFEAPKKNNSISDDLIDKLKRLGELKEKGILTQEEFNEQKKRLLR